MATNSNQHRAIASSTGCVAPATHRQGRDVVLANEGTMPTGIPRPEITDGCGKPCLAGPVTVIRLPALASKRQISGLKSNSHGEFWALFIGAGRMRLLPPQVQKQPPTKPTALWRSGNSPASLCGNASQPGQECCYVQWTRKRRFGHVWHESEAQPVFDLTCGTMRRRHGSKHLGDQG